MEKPELQVFGKKASDLLDRIKKEAHDKAVYSGSYSLNEDDTYRQREKEVVFEGCFKVPNIEFDLSTLSVTHATIPVPLSQAERFLSNFSYNMSSPNINLLRVVYQLKYKGDLSALDYTVQYPKRIIDATMNGGGTLAIFFYHTKPVSEVKDSIKEQRDKLLNLIIENQKEVYDYFVSKKQEVINAIDLGYELGLQKARKQKEDNDSLL